MARTKDQEQRANKDHCVNQPQTMKHTNNLPQADLFRNMEHHLGGPNYRWKHALQYAASPQLARPQHVDQIGRVAARYVRAYQHYGAERAKQKYPLIAAARALYENDQMLETFKLAVLGNLPQAEVAARLGVAVEIIEIAEVLFFQLGDLRESEAWLNCHVFLPAIKTGSTDSAAKMKLAYHGGPEMARELLDAQDGPPFGEAQRLVDQELLLHAKLQAALEFELDAASASEYIKYHLAYDLARRSIELEREKFQHECQLPREQRSGEGVQQPADIQPQETT
jgi:hypothetical protein